MRSTLCRLMLWLAIALCGVPGAAQAQEALHKVGMTQVEFTDPADGRTLNHLLIYPATPAPDAQPAKLLFSTHLELYEDAPALRGAAKRPLVVFSHGAGGNAAGYAWFGQYLAERGYIVAMLYHYQANTYDANALYMRNRIWQRPRDIAVHITHLLADPTWGPRIDPDRIGVAGHSLGGFTSLWVGGAQVNPGRFETYQRWWKHNPVVPAYLRNAMKVDATPALQVRDPRIKAAFSMAPGDVQGFGMDAAGLARMPIPAYIIVGEGDKVTPPEDNAAFAARHIPQATLDVLPGPVGHEIFVNECDQIGRENTAEACIDAAGVDRAALHRYIGDAAKRFFDQNFGR